jgi:GNAT superfamily N-acetyltransferase
MPQPTIRRAGPADAATLGTIAPAAYAEAYAHIFADPAAYARRLADFGAEAFARLLARPDARVWCAELDSEVVGFLTLLLGVPDPIDQLPNAAEIPRIYLLGPTRGMGIGAHLLAAAEAEARANGTTTLWLDAMESAPWAWRTYQRWGFEPVGTIRFDQPVKPGLETLIVLRKPLLPAS